MRTRVLNHFHTFHPDAQAEHDRLVKEERDLTRRMAREGGDEEAPRRRMSEPQEAISDAVLTDVRAKIEAQRAVIASGVVRLVVGSLPRGEFRRLVVKHPPQDDDADPDLSRQVGYGDSFIDALIKACTVQTLAHELLGGGPVPNELDKWLAEMTDGQAGDIFQACLKVNNDGEPVFPR